MNKINLRKVFVQLLFSLAIGQVALKSGSLVVAGATMNDYYYSYLHLLLCVIIITSSWVGWHNSKSPHNSDAVESVFSLQYAILLVDMFLVVCYFIIVNGAEVDSKLENIPLPNSHIEVMWTMIIFSTYLIWDIITKLVEFDFKYDHDSKTIKRKIRLTKIFPKRIAPTFLCWAFSVIFYYYMNDENRIHFVAIIDVILIALFLTFRGFKQDVKKVYQISKKQISEDLIEKFPDVSYPVNVEDGKIFYNLKYFTAKIFPLSLVIIGFIIYMYLR